jgi:hypothetical protein
MAWDASRNAIYAERCRNVAVAAQNLAEEAQRLRTVFVQQLQSNPAAFADTPIATKAEITTFQSYLTELLTFHNGGGTLTNTARGTAWTLPLIDTSPAS